ncbi:MAG: response regulator [Elusimicrobia bacterium]|nr:response regulator [Elusimicrobiota bacterium]
MNIFGLGAKKKKILVVEDNLDIAENLEARLTVQGYEVHMAPDGKEGVEKTRTELPDLVILDVMMPKIDGYQACRIIKQDEKTRHIPVLMLTSLQLMGDAEKAFEAGADDFLSKPFTNDQLLRKIRKHVP